MTTTPGTVPSLRRSVPQVRDLIRAEDDTSRGISYSRTHANPRAQLQSGKGMTRIRTCARGGGTRARPLRVPPRHIRTLAPRIYITHSARVRASVFSLMILAHRYTVRLFNSHSVGAAAEKIPPPPGGGVRFPTFTVRYYLPHHTKALSVGAFFPRARAPKAFPRGAQIVRYIHGWGSL